MKVENKHDLAKKSKDFETKQFAIADMSIVIELLTKLYSNPKGTLTQEYISNGRDANREVGEKRRIEITAPSTWMPTLYVRDFGPGLTPQRINDVFLFYGASTKSNDNKQTGGFGIGAKSAWAYTNSFTVTSYVDGMKRTYVCHKSGGNGNLDLISEEATNEPNGAEIQIPVEPKDIASFKAAILRTVFYWKEEERPILKGFDDIYGASFDITKIQNYSEYKVNNQVSMIKNGYPWFIDGTYSVNMSNGGNLIVIDGIPYPIRGQLQNCLNQLTSKVKSNYIIKVNTGDLRVAPTREDIIDEERNHKVLKEIAKRAVEDCDVIINNELDKHIEIKDKLKEFINLYQIFNINNTCDRYHISYSGGGLAIGFIKSNSRYFSRYDYKLKQYTDAKINLDLLDRLYYDDVEESKAKRKFRLEKMRQSGDFRILVKPNDLPPNFDQLADWQQNNIKDALVSEEDYNKLIHDLEVKPLSSISIEDYAKKGRTSSGSSVQKKEICLHIFNECRLNPTQLDVADINYDVIYASLDSAHYKNRDSAEFMQLARYIKSLGKSMAFIAKGSIDKIKDEINFFTIEEFLKEHLPTDDEIKVSLVRFAMDKYRPLLPLRDIKECDTIVSKDLKVIIDIFKLSSKEGSAIPFSLFERITESNVYREVYDYIAEPEKKLNELSKKYALLGYCLNWNIHRNEEARKELIYYINSKE